MEHGIQFNKPYTRASWHTDTTNVKSKIRLTGTSYGGVSDTPEILIPLSVIGEEVFSVSMMFRTLNTETEYEVVGPNYPGGMPTTNSFYWQESERLAYFTMTPLKSFIDEWKLRE